MTKHRIPAVIATALISTWALLSAGCPSTPNPNFRREALAPDLGANQGEVGLATKQSLLAGPRARGRVGDWVLRNGRIVAIFRRQDGKLLDLGFRDRGRDLFAGLTTTVSDTRGTYRVHYAQARIVSIQKAGSKNTHRDRPGPSARGTLPPAIQGLEFFGRVRDRDLNLEVRTRVWLLPDRPLLVFRTWVRNASRKKVVRLGIGDETYFGNVPIFVPGHGMVTRSCRIHAEWLAQETAGRTLALVTDGTGPMALRFRVYSQGFHPGIRATYRYADLAQGEHFTATRYLFLGNKGLAAATSAIQRLLGGPLCRTTLLLPRLPVGSFLPTRVQVERSGRPVLDALLSGKAETIVLPAGPPAQARIWISGAGFGPWMDVACSGKTAPLAPSSAVLRYEVTEGRTGKRIPARILVRGLHQTPDPNFGALDRLAGTASTAYSLDGKGVLVLAPGTYLVTALHGPEYSWDVQSLTLVSGTERNLRFVLAHLVDTKGAISADLHLHAAPSSDSELSLGTRLGQLAATGVEAAVATDHNAVSDYRPALKTAGLEGRMFVLSGVEATTKRSLLGHFNLFPLPPGSAPPPYENRTPEAFFSAWKALPGHPILQVNHPRLTYLGYFNQVDFDPDLGKAFAPHAVLDFDAIEVFNGTRMHNPGRIEDLFTDWFTLLNLGKKITGTGNSDSHKLVYQEAGYPRTYLLAGTDTPSGLTPEILKQTLRSHQVVAGSGPYLSITTEKGSIVGKQVRSPLDAQLTIQAPCWLSVDRLALVANGRVLRRWSISGQRAELSCNGSCETGASVPAPSHRTGIIGLAPPSHRPMTPGTCKAQVVRVPVRLNPREDTWYLFVAWSTKDNPTLPRPGGLVLSFTNPVWVDADGNGKFTPPSLPHYPLR